jgi:all-trans-8'-apo-beta-carotenal 15,15'-oxygenase
MNQLNINRRSLIKSFAVSGVAAPFSSTYGSTLKRESAFIDASQPYQGISFDGAIATSNISVRGKIPPGLQGTLYRNGAARFNLGTTRHTHWFDGDGMVQAFTFEGGKASHRGVLLQTPKLKEETRAGRFLYKGFGTEMLDSRPIENPDQVNTANINILSMQGGRELYALWEGGSALQLDPKTLAAKSFKVWSPETAGAPFSAHPRRSPDGTLWNFGYAPHSGSLILYEIDVLGKLKRQTVIAAPQADMVHDFAITENYLVFLLMPLEVKTDTPPVGSLDRYQWQSDRAMIAMLVKKSDFSFRRFELPNGGVFHLGNAWEDNGILRLAYARYSKFLEHLKGLTFPTPKSQPDELASWHEIELNLNDGAAKQFNTGLNGVEFPSFNTFQTGQNSDFTVLMQNTHAKANTNWGMDTVLTWSRGKSQRFTYGPQWLAEEHLFVPTKPNASSSQGWILGTAYNYVTQKTTLSIFDARSLHMGPIAQLELPYGLPLGLHGQFVYS